MAHARMLVVFTDLDGTLLDHRTYSFEAASGALAHIGAAGVPLVLCSSKTRLEIERVRQRLNSFHPFVSENGAAVFIPPDYFPFAVPGARERDGYLVLEYGRPYREVVDLLRRTAARLDVAVEGFSNMSAQQIADACGLPLEDARLARAREYDEPFRVLDGGSAARDRLRRALRRAGLQSVAGGRFDHATSGADKGASVTRLTAQYRRLNGQLLTVGLGDSLSDLSLLRAVDIPVIVRNPGAGATAQLRRKLPGARVTDIPGPAGWAEAVDRILVEHGLRLAPLPPARGEGGRDDRPARRAAPRGRRV